MDGIHDMGGMQGFGPVVRDEAVFHAPWERRAFALASLARIESNTDDFRHAVERLDPTFYLTAGYYGRWLGALEVRLADRGLLDPGETDARAGSTEARPSATGSEPFPDRGQVGGPVRDVAHAPKFSVGDTVEVRDLHPSGHTRLPGYLRRRRGTVTAVHPAFVFPDSNAHGRGEDPQHVYAVRFTAADLWGAGDHTVSADLFEPYLEAT